MSASPSHFTVAEALQLEVLRAAKMRAGASGLARPIQWVHIVEIPDIPRWVKGGELLLTDARALVSDLGRNPQLIETLHRLDIAGVIYSVMEEVHELPASMLETADRLQLPIIEVPYEFHYVEVTEAILRRLVDHQGMLIRQAMQTHLRLTQLVLAGGTLADLAKASAELVPCAAVLIEDQDFQPLAQVAAAPLKFSARALPPTALTELQATHKPYAQASEVVAPIVVGAELLGYLALLGVKPTLDQLGWQTVESVTTVAALILLRQRAIADTEARFRGDVLAQLVEGTFQEDAATQQVLARYGLHGEAEHQVLVLELETGTLARETNLLLRLEQMLAQAGHKTLHGLLGRRWVALLEFRRNPHAGLALAQKLCELSPIIRLGLGSVISGWPGVHHSYQNALDALAIVSRAPQLGRQYAAFDELGYLHWLLKLSEAERRTNPYTRKIETLIAYDRKRGGELMVTLEAYLAEGGNGQQTARHLHIHRSTLNYRLERIADVCEANLSDPLVRLNLYLALKAQQLAGR